MELEHLEDWMMENYKWFHENPELSYEEYNTTAKIRELLSQCGIEILQASLDTGVAAIVRGKKPGPIQALRADIDALPVAEDTGLSYCSKVPGKMHACGHDFHITAGLGCAILLGKRSNELCGDVRIFFQPAEESALGALKILDTDLMDGVSRTWGFHTSPRFDCGTLGISPGYVAASVDKFFIKVKGTGSHGAKPHEGIDPIPAACAIVSALQTIVTRNINAFHPVVVSVTRIEAGKTWNVTPVYAELEGTVRTMDKEDRLLIEKRMSQIIENTAKAYGCGSELDWVPGSPAVDNDPDMADLAAAAGRRAGYDIAPEGEVMSGDDFAFYQDRTPACYIRIGTGKGAALHQPGFKADPNMLLPAAEYLADLLIGSSVHFAS